MTVEGVGEVGNTSIRTSQDKVKKTYWTWKAMLRRCFNEDDASYANYGGRGITVCKRWLTFANYEKDLEELPGAGDSVDRIDNDGDYCPSNCRWATRQQQNVNSRATRPFVAYPPGFSGKGAGMVTMNQSAFAERFGLDHSTISKCLRGVRSQHKGWRFEYV